MTTICPECGSDRINERHIGRTTGSIADGVAGALSGAGTGAVTGSAMDGVLFDRFECRNCEHTFD
ncbi:hypothetical protein CBW54_00525 [Yersinia kristensenii]|nr:hypothetical protein CBW54_00525 [Yersinia kristensenii]